MKNLRHPNPIPAYPIICHRAWPHAVHGAHVLFVLFGQIQYMVPMYYDMFFYMASCHNTWSPCSMTCHSTWLPHVTTHGPCV